MICRDCRMAGRVAADPSSGLLSPLGRAEEARILHGQCPGGSWCDCQHELPPELKPDDPAPRPSP